MLLEHNTKISIILVGILALSIFNPVLISADTKYFALPAYVKESGIFWIDEKIDDSDFTKTIGTLIQHNIIDIPNFQSLTQETTAEIPSWVKSTTKFWVDEHISDIQYVNSIKWLVNNGIITISTNEIELESRSEPVIEPTVKPTPEIEEVIPEIETFTQYEPPVKVYPVCSNCIKVTIVENISNDLPDLTVKHLEITQAIQDLQNSIPLVSQKQTWIRVYVDKNTDESISDVTAILHIKNTNRDTTATLTPYLSPSILETNSLDEQRRDISQTINFELPKYWTLAGDYEYTVQLNPKNDNGEFPVKESNHANNEYGPIKNTIHLTKPIKINFHPVTVDESWCKKPTVEDFQNYLNGYLMKVYPISKWEITQGPEIKLWDTPKLNANGLWLLEARLGYYEYQDKGGPIEVGMVCNNPNVDYGGMGFSNIAWSYPNAKIFAHEIAHALGIHHTPINPKTFFDDIKRQDSGDPVWIKHVKGAEVWCKDSKNSHFLIGELLEDDDYPKYNSNLHRPTIGEYGFDGYHVYDPTYYSDFMSYCTTYPTAADTEIMYGGDWISPYTYSKLLDKFLK